MAQLPHSLGDGPGLGSTGMGSTGMGSTGMGSTGMGSMRQLDKVDPVDPELLALPAPPRGGRLVVLGLMAAVAVAAALTLIELRKDVGYFFASRQAEVLGDAARLDPGELTPNRYVRVEGTPMLSSMLRFERQLTHKAYVVFALAGQRQLFVQMPVETLRNGPGPHGVFSGRLVTFGDMGSRMSGIRGVLQADMDLPVTAETFLLRVDERPGAATGALGLAFVCVVCLFIQGVLWVRWFRIS